DRLDNADRNREALPLYLEANELRPGDAEILRRIAKQYSQRIADTDSKREKRRLGELSIEFALAAVEADPDNAQARLGLAICYGRVAFMESPRTRIEYSRLIRRETEYSLDLDPDNDIAWH